MADEKRSSETDSENKFDNEEVREIFKRIKELKKKRTDLYKIDANKIFGPGSTYFYRKRFQKRPFR